MTSNANIGALSFNRQNSIIPLLNAGALGKTLTTVSTQIVAQNPQTQEITFVNLSSTIIAYVCQATDANGAALVAGALPGNFPILPLASFTFRGNGVGLAWLGASASATVALTIVSSQTQGD